jgi:hypothetical protein
MNTASKNNKLRTSANPLYPTMRLHGHRIDCVYDMSGTVGVLCTNDSRRPSAEKARRLPRSIYFHRLMCFTEFGSRRMLVHVKGDRHPTIVTSRLIASMASSLSRLARTVQTFGARLMLLFRYQRAGATRACR